MQVRFLLGLLFRWPTKPFPEANAEGEASDILPPLSIKEAV
jgi:hypothetical protein